MPRLRPDTVRFTFLTGDTNWADYGGKWISQKCNNGEFDYWFVMSLINWEDSVGEQEAEEVGAKYNVSLKVISPSEFVDKEGALRSSGIDQSWDELDEKMQVELIESYSGGAQIFSENGNNFRKLFKAAREKAYTSEMLFGFVMDKPQNAIGSTGWDFLKGDIMAGLTRYVESKKNESPEMNLMAEISGVKIDG